MPHKAPHLKPEVNLLVCCARRPAADTPEIQACLAKPLDWDLLLSLAKENSLLPLLCERLLQSSHPAVSEDVLSRLRRENRQHALRSLALTAELLRVVGAFRQAQISALPYKGPVLAQTAYGDSSLRDFDDLDIVVPQKFMPDAYDEMLALGYESKLPRARFHDTAPHQIPGEYLFVHKVNGALVELHTEFTLRHFPRPPEIGEMAGRAIAESLNGKQVSTFSRADNLLMLCVHGAKDFWSRLIWVADVAALAQKLSVAEWQSLFAEAERYDAVRIVNLGLLLANAVLEVQLPSDVSQCIARDRVAARLAAELRACLLGLREPSRGLFWRSRYRIAMVQGLARGVRYWLRLSTAPAEEDWSAADPAATDKSFSLRRPLRLWRKYRNLPSPEEPRAKQN